MNAHTMTPDDLPVKEGVMALLGAGGIGAIWQAIRIFRRGWREDAAAERTAATYRGIIASMEAAEKVREEQTAEQVKRLENRLAAAEKRTSELEDRLTKLNQRATDAINEKYEAEFRARRLESERNAYKAELDDLKGRGKDWERGL